MQNNSVWSIKEIITIIKIKFQNFISRKQMTPSEANGVVMHKRIAIVFSNQRREIMSAIPR